MDHRGRTTERRARSHRLESKAWQSQTKIRAGDEGSRTSSSQPRRRGGDVKTQTRRVKDGESERDVERKKAPTRTLVEEDVQALIERAMIDRKLSLEDPTRVRCLKSAQNFKSPFSKEIETADPPR